MLTTPASPADRFNARASVERWATHCDPALRFEDERLASLVGIWRAVGADGLPKREDFTARILARHLQHLTFVERIDGRYRFRLFGTALARFTGDWTGRFLDETVPAQFLPSWLATYDTTLEARAPLRFTARFRAAELAHIQAETLAAPLADAAGEAAGLLISVAYTPVVT